MFWCQRRILCNHENGGLHYYLSLCNLMSLLYNYLNTYNTEINLLQSLCSLVLEIIIVSHDSDFHCFHLKLESKFTDVPLLVCCTNISRSWFILLTSYYLQYLEFWRTTKFEICYFQFWTSSFVWDIFLITVILKF